MSFIEKMKRQARDFGNVLVLPESTEERTLKAARIIMDEKLVSKLILVGNKEEIEEAAGKASVKITGVDIVDPKHSPFLEKAASAYYEKRKEKGLTKEEAITEVVSDLGFAAMMLSLGEADAMVAGAKNTTSDVLRAGLKMIGTKPGMKTASSCFLMDTQNPHIGSNGILVFSDCAVLPSPSAEQLADIACSAAQSFVTYTGADPIVALLSYSTKGSGGDKDPNILKVREAYQILKDRRVHFTFDGEIQLDCALVPSVMQKKAPDSPVKGRANTLVFPDLAAGNIGYKLVQRLAGAEALGPFLQGFAKPISDLSRGCSVNDIVTTAAITLVQAGSKQKK